MVSASQYTTSSRRGLDVDAIVVALWMLSVRPKADRQLRQGQWISWSPKQKRSSDLVCDDAVTELSMLTGPTIVTFDWLSR